MNTETLAIPNVDVKPSLADSTVLLHFSAGTIGNSRKVPAQDAEITANVLNLNKKLLDSPELATIRIFDGEFRRWLDTVCLPFEERGVRILTLQAVARVDKRVREYIANRAPLVDAFLAVYEIRIAEAERRLKTVEVGGRVYNLFRASDYLSEREARARFYVDYHYRSLSDTPVSLASISPELLAEEREKGAARISAVADEISGFLRASLAELVTHLRDKLTPSENGKPKRLFDTAITNLTEFLSNLPFRNATGDSDLEKYAAQLRILLDGKSPDMFRESDSLRVNVAENLAGIKAALDVMVEEKPSRKFRFED